MMSNGCDCAIVIKTQHREMGVPYVEETIREAYSLLNEEAAIEGNGVCGGLRSVCGVTGCVVTPLGIGSAPLLLCLAFGAAGLPVFVSETRNVYRSVLRLSPLEDCPRFTLAQDRGGQRRQYHGCAVTAFELRFNRGAAVKLKLAISGNCPADVYPYGELPGAESGERFSGDCIRYWLNGREYTNIYGLTISSKKEGGTRTELFIKRSLRAGEDLPGFIEELTITAGLVREKYEWRSFGLFRITFERLALVSDETAVDCADCVIGPLRYYVAGSVAAEVYSGGDEVLQ